MRKSLLDDLARTLATPMPRRQALRTIGATLAMSAFRMLRPGPAAGYADGCHLGEPCEGFPNTTWCCVPVGGYGGYHSGGCCLMGGPLPEECCIGPNDDEGHPNPMSWCCPKGTCAPSWRAGAAVQGCFEKRTCKSDEMECGKTCCKPGEFCGSTLRSVCCKAGENACVVPRGDAAVCCRPGTKCCFNMTSANCCDANHACVNGSCKCRKDETACGDACCTKSEVCANGQCCPKRQVCSTAAGKKCCKQGEYCATIAGARGNKNCCPISRIARTKSGVPVCCPTGTVVTARNACCPPANPNCCSTDDLVQVCPKGFICSLGECVAI